MNIFKLFILSTSIDYVERKFDTLHGSQTKQIRIVVSSRSTVDNCRTGVYTGGGI